jgi:Ca2+-binding EF-hand superfamily protein
VDALKVIMVLLGEQLDDEELQDIFNEYDTNLTGRMDFVAFIALMKGNMFVYIYE